MGKPNFPMCRKQAPSDTVGEVTSSCRGEENPDGQSIGEAPSSADNRWMVPLSHVPGHPDTRAPLIEVSWNALWHGGLVRSCALAHENRGSPHGSLRLRVPSAIPAEPVGDGKVSRQLPFVLPIEA